MTTTAAAPVESWLTALRTSSARLADTVAPLSDEELSRPSFAGEWSIAQVLSHLGSGAEICSELVERGIAGGTAGPRREDLLPIWDRWNALGPAGQRAQWLTADARHLRLLESISEEDRTSVRVPYFAGRLDLPTYAGYRLSEQSIHAWDVQVALDSTAVIPEQETALLWERLDLVATRFRDGESLSRIAPERIAVKRTDAPRTAALLLDSELHLYPCEPAEPTATLAGGTEALLRLVYGRNRPEHDSVTVTGSVTLDDLRALFPGF